MNIIDWEKEIRRWEEEARRWDKEIDFWRNEAKEITDRSAVLGTSVSANSTQNGGIRIANQASFNVLLSSLPAGARRIIRMDNNNFIDARSVNTAYLRYNRSGNMQALRTITADKRTVYFDATATSYDYINSEAGIVGRFHFRAPTRVNDFQKLLNLFTGTPEEKQLYAQELIRQGIVDEVSVVGDFGVVLRPFNAQQPFPVGRISTTDNFEVYINPVGTTPMERAKYVGHELFGHLYFFFTGKDPRHGGASGSLNGNPLLEQQIDARERESIFNFGF